MKKALFILIMVLSVHAAFGSQEVKYRDYGYTPDGIGMVAGSIIMMSLSSIQLTGSSVIIILSACGAFSYVGGHLMELFSIPFILSSQTFIAGSLILYLAVKKYGEKSYNYYYDVGKIMRNAGIVILATSAVPIACAAINAGCSIPLALQYGYDDYVDGFFIAECVFSVLQLACGTAFLAMGLHRIHKDKMLFPELSIVHDDKKGFDEGYSLIVGARISL